MGLFTKLLQKQNSYVLSNLSAIEVDMHSHLIPGIDDGSKSIEESIIIIEQLKDLGYKKIITTPHIQEDFYKNTPEIIYNGLDILRQALKDKNIGIEIHAAAEYLLSPFFDQLVESKQILTFGDNYVLVEMSYFSPYAKLKQTFFNLQSAGYQIILAHPERYSYYHNDFSLYTDLKNRDIFFQLNIISLTGAYSNIVKKIAEKLIDNNMIEFLGTDAHSTSHIDLLTKSLKEKYLKKIIDIGIIKNNQL